MKAEDEFVEIGLQVVAVQTVVDDQGPGPSGWMEKSRWTKGTPHDMAVMAEARRAGVADHAGARSLMLAPVPRRPGTLLWEICGNSKRI